MRIRKFIMKNVRCFADEQEFAIRPITLLTNEDSTGKSTMLGCLHALHRFIQQSDLDFNVKPYSMGSFADIVRKSRPAIDSFQLGIEIGGGNESRNKALKYTLTLSERDKGSEPVVQEQNISLPSGAEIAVKKNSNPNPKHDHIAHGIRFRSISDKEGKKKIIFESDDDYGMERSLFLSLPRLFYELLADSEESLNGGDRSFLRTAWKEIEDLIGEKKVRLPHQKQRRREGAIAEKKVHSHPLPIKMLRMESFMNRMHSFAPIHSQPLRTYDPIKEAESPEGNEMPIMLNNLSRTDKEGWRELKKKLVDFGKSSGLFAGIDLRKLGKSKSAPFQLQIKVRGPKVNLKDTGYGVSQILPILVDVFRSRPGSYFLMQQPEIHTYPKVQAELTSSLVNLAQTMNHSFIIETHSDYIIDRARIEIAKGNIKPEDVSLIYLEPIGNKVKAHNIEFDKASNMLNVPESFREFFKQEADDFLGF